MKLSAVAAELGTSVRIAENHAALAKAHAVQLQEGSQHNQQRHTTIRLKTSSMSWKKRDQNIVHLLHETRIKVILYDVWIWNGIIMIIEFDTITDKQKKASDTIFDI